VAVNTAVEDEPPFTTSQQFNLLEEVRLAIGNLLYVFLVNSLMALGVLGTAALSTVQYNDLSKVLVLSHFPKPYQKVPKLE